ncbi:MAG TPA: molybdopterin dinucleotide binding domain-containing protein, partial [Chitinophagales bacterium]|nr:molybdopterin dinucleotide binding domain-containing protein [Chitinophagales bacterium]
IHPIDAAAYNIEMGDKVYVESPRGHVIVKAKITDEVLPGILSSTFHFPEVMLNRITSNISDSETMCPEFKVVACKISKLTT